MKIKVFITAAFIGILAVFAFIPPCLAASGIEFTAELKIDDTWIEPGGTAYFTVELNNTGSVNITRFEIITPDAKLAGKYGALKAGKSASVEVPIIFDNPGEYPVELFVAGYRGKNSLTVHTNEITITVSNDPEPTPTPEPTQNPAASPDQSEAAAAIAAAAPSAEASDVAASVAASDAAASGSSAVSGSYLIYIAAAVLGVLAAGVTAAVIVIAAGRKIKKQ